MTEGQLKQAIDFCRGKASIGEIDDDGDTTVAYYADDGSMCTWNFFQSGEIIVSFVGATPQLSFSFRLSDT